jgi:hypothetical protein
VAIGQETAEVLIACTGFDQDREDRTILHGQFRADDGANTGFFGLRVKPRRPVYAVAIGQRNGGQAKFGSEFGEMLRKRGAAQEAERAAGVEFDITGSRLRR